MRPYRASYIPDMPIVVHKKRPRFQTHQKVRWSPRSRVYQVTEAVLGLDENVQNEGGHFIDTNNEGYFQPNRMSRFNKEDRLNWNKIKNKAASSVESGGARVGATSRDQQTKTAVGDPFEKIQPDPATMAVLEDILGKKRV